MGYVVNAISSTGDCAVIGEGAVFDFTQNLTIDIGDVPSGMTCSAIVLQLFYQKRNLPDLLDVVINEGGSKTLSSFFMPSINGQPVTELAFGAGVSQVKFYDQTATPVNSVIPGVNSIDNIFILGRPGDSRIVFPFTAVNLSGSSVTLSISIDLTNIIEKYPNDVYIIRNNWWESVDLYASVQ